LGCGVAHKDLATYLNGAPLSADITLVCVASGDDVTMFMFKNKVIVSAMSLDLTKYDTAQGEEIIDAEILFFEKLLPEYKTFIKQIFKEYFHAQKEISVRDGENRIKFNLKRTIRLSGGADTSFGNTLINLGLCFYIFSQSKDLNEAYEIAMGMSDVGFKYTGAKPGPELRDQTFLRSVIVKDNMDKLRLVPSLGVLIKPLLRIKNTDSWGCSYEDLDSDKLELIIKKYYKSYFHAFKDIVTNPIFQELEYLWSQENIEIDEGMIENIREMFEYTIIAWETDEFRYNFSDMLERYKHLDAGTLRTFMMNLFSPVSVYGRSLSAWENELLVNIMVVDYGVERSRT
jgi:hypothetical protein